MSKKAKRKQPAVRASRQAELDAAAQMMREQMAALTASNVDSNRRHFRESLFFQFLSEGMKPTEAANKVAMTANDLWARMHASETTAPVEAPAVVEPGATPVAVVVEAQS